MSAARITMTTTPPDERGASHRHSSRAVGLLTQGLFNPLGIQTREPEFSFFVEADDRARPTASCQIRAASSADLLAGGDADLWDSGQVPLDLPSRIGYGGRQLGSRQRVYWSVRLWDEAGNASPWSAPAWFEMGLVEPDDWTASWVGQGDAYSGNRSAVPLIVKDFAARSAVPIDSARLYISGLGVFEASMNGRRISDHLFEPGESDNRETVNYVTYDVTDAVQPGDNVLGVMLGNGFYGMYSEVDNVVDGIPRYVKWDGIEMAPDWERGLYGRLKVIAQLEITYSDGSRDVVESDDTWLYTPGPITFSNWLSGEDFDSRKVIADWDVAGTSREGWCRVRLMAPPPGALTAREVPAIRAFQTVEAIAAVRLDDTRVVVDFGRNGAGVPQLVVRTRPEHAGQTLRIFPAEVVRSDGSVDQASVKGEFDYGEMCSTWTLAGTGVEMWAPRFTYYGCRYLEIHVGEGMGDWQPTPADFRMHLVRTANEQAGTLHTSNDEINAINRIITRAIESNMFSTLTDCPHIEKAGWLECTHLLHDSIAVAFDVEAWMRKLMRDAADAQLPSGEGSAIAPPFQHVNFLSRDPNWGGALVLAPFAQYQEYGDRALLERMYPHMERYVGFLLRQCDGNGLLLNYAQMGEWGGYDTSTSKDFTASATFHRLLRVMAEVSSLTGRAGAARRYESMADRVRRAVRGRFLDHASGVFDSGSQASYALAISSGLVEAEHVETTVDRLVARIAEDGNHLTSGEVGLKHVFSVLAEHGRSDTVYRMIMNPTMPSYLHFVRSGMTTLPEYWDMARSLNHAMMGHAKAWFHRHLLGLRPTLPGYGAVDIAPFFPSDVDWVEGVHVARAGKFALRWGLEDARRRLRLDITLPVGVFGTLRLPAARVRRAVVDGAPLAWAVGVDCFELTELPSGTHQIIVDVETKL